MEMKIRSETGCLASDIEEQHNLADSDPEQRDKLHELLKVWRDEVGARLPIPQADASTEPPVASSERP